MTGRERTLSGIGALAALFFAAKWVVYDYILKPINERKARMATLEDSRSAKQFQVLMQEEAQKHLADWKKSALADREGDAAGVKYQEFVQKLLEKAGVKNATVTMQPAKSTKNHYAVLPVALKFNCDLGQITKLLYYLRASDPHHVVRKLNFLPQHKDDKLEKLSVDMDLETLLLKDAVGKDKLEVATKDARKIEEFKLLAEKNFFQPTNLVSISAPPPRDRPDERRKYVLTGVTRGLSGVPELWFTHESTKKSTVVAVGKKLDIPGMSALVESFDYLENHVVLRVNSKLGVVRMGRDLSTWKEIADRPATVTQRP